MSKATTAKAPEFEELATESLLEEIAKLEFLGAVLNPQEDMSVKLEGNELCVLSYILCDIAERLQCCVPESCQ